MQTLATASTPDPWTDVISRIKTVRPGVPKTGLPNDYEALQKEQQIACATDNLMQCYMVGYKFLRLADLGYFDAYADAISTFKLILDKDPKFGRAHYGLGRVYYALSLTDLMVRDKMQTGSSGLLVPVLDQQSADLFQGALDEFQTAFALDLELANDSDARNFIEMTKAKLEGYWIRQGYEMETRGNPAAAIEHYEKALRLNPQSFVANFNEGNAFFALFKFREAIQAYDKALGVSPNSAEAVNNREIARLREAGIRWPDGSQAIEFLKKDLKGAERNTRIGAALILFLECSKKNQEACSIMTAAFQETPTLLDELKKLDMQGRQ
jgi:tetratricopeptide (TPR) repeat protein